MDDQHHDSEPLAEPSTSVPIDAEVITPAGNGTRPRLWTVWTMVVLVVVFSLQVNLVSVLIAQLAVFGELRMPDDEMIVQLMRSRIGFAMMLLSSQLAILIPPLIAAYLSPQSFRQRLGLVRGQWPVWAWVTGAIATPLIGLITTMVLSPFVDESEHLKQMSEVFRDHARGGFLAATLLMVGGLPAICEELMFRGYVQTRLAGRLPSFVAIFIASLLFALFHFDPVHVIAVLPIGLWLGYLRHAGASILPAMIAHGFNNVLSVISVMPEDAGAFDAPSTMLSLVLLGLGIPCLLATLAAGWFYSRND